MTTQAAVIIVLIAHVVAVMPMRLTLKSFIQVDLRLESIMRCTTIEQPMILPVIVIVVHAVWIVRWRVGAWGSVGRGRVGVGLEKASVVPNGRAVAVTKVYLGARV